MLNQLSQILLSLFASYTCTCDISETKTVYDKAHNFCLKYPISYL